MQFTLTQNDLQQAIGSVFLQFWGLQKQLEETQAELAKVKTENEALKSKENAE